MSIFSKLQSNEYNTYKYSLHLTHHSINENSPDFQMFTHILQSSQYNIIEKSLTQSSIQIQTHPQRPSSASSHRIQHQHHQQVQQEKSPRSTFTFGGTKDFLHMLRLFRLHYFLNEDIIFFLKNAWAI